MNVCRRSPKISTFLHCQIVSRVESEFILGLSLSCLQIGKSKLDGASSNVDAAGSAISALDSKSASATGSAIESRTSNVASRISASNTGSRISNTGSSLGSTTGSSLSSKAGSSALGNTPEFTIMPCLHKMLMRCWYVSTKFSNVLSLPRFKK